MDSLFTDKVNRVLPLNDYPRPQMVRDSWINLNGTWKYKITHSDIHPSDFDGEILVPFSPECDLSGVGHILMPDEYLWYERTFEIPRSYEGKRIILHFGAVDCEASVYVNGRNVINHVGGYLPFSADITDFLSDDENTLTLKVRDFTDTSYHSRGKQSMKRGGIWYTPQSGIWQTVWIEPVPKKHIGYLKITPDYDTGSVYIETDSPDATAVFEGKEYPLPGRISVENFEAWSPENPKLYDFSVICGEDRVESYFAIRKFSVEKDENGVKRFFLNGKPYFNNGLLDQGYWSDGMYTAPTDEALIYDIQLAKDMGFNVLRKHIKVEPLRWYYHCDRLGMIVWQDMINGGRKYNQLLITAPLVTNLHLKDQSYALFARQDKEGRDEYADELTALINHLYNCPSVGLWVIFNEGWGQFDAVKAYEKVLETDKTRIIDTVSGWHDQNIGDVRSWHVYFRKYKFQKDKLSRAVILSEFGGFSCKIEGHTFNDKFFGYKRYDTPEELYSALKSLYRDEIAPAKEKGLAAAIYTELTDIEDELNGLVTYDRKVVKIEPKRLKEIVSV